MSKPLANLINNIHLEKIEINIFRGVTLDSARGQVFGGQVLAQAINAAQRTVGTPLVLHSLHAYFLRPGDTDTPIIYDVDRIRDGRSFTTRRVVAIQHGRAIFNVSLSFQLREEGFEHQADMPDVPMPEELISDEVLYSQARDRTRAPQREWPIEYRQVEPAPHADSTSSNSKRYVWFKSAGYIADDLSQHQELLAYASNSHILPAALRIHGRSHRDKNLRVASLDHAMWFHRQFRIDDWLLYELDSPSASGARGFTQGRIYSRDGLLIASVVQEGLIREESGRH